MELSTWENLIRTQSDKCGVTKDVEYLKKANNKVNDKTFYNELPTDSHEDHQDTLINSQNYIARKIVIEKKHQWH